MRQKLPQFVKKNFLKQLGWGDWILFGVLLFAASYAWEWNRVAEGSKRLVEISQNGQRSLYPLEEERRLVLRDDENGEQVMLVRIQDEQVWVQESNCALQYCVQRGAIQDVGQWVACLPNEVFIRILSPQKGDTAFDAEVF